MERSFYPYLPLNREILYVSSEDRFILEARKMWSASGCRKQPTGSVVVKDGRVIGEGNNTTLHRVDVCPRDEQGFKTGEGYHLCKEVCQQVSGHSETTAVADAAEKGHDATEGDLYLYGHWWCCENCWNAMIAAGIKNVYLLEGASPDTIWK